MRWLTIALLLALPLLSGPAAPAANVAVGQVQAPQNAEKRLRGIELYRQGKFVEAIKSLEGAVKENKTDHEAWYYLGLAFFQQPKKIKDAINAFETAIELRPQFAAAHIALSYTSLRQNRFSEAVRESRAALSIDPKLAEPHYIIGLVHVRAGDSEEALNEAREALRLNPNFHAAYLLKSQALISAYANKALGSTRFSQTSPRTPEQIAERSKRRLEAAALLKEAGETLQTYLKLNPSEPSAELWQDQLATLKVYGSYTGDKSNLSDAPVAAEEVTTKARILAKPEPAYTELVRRAQVTGKVVLRVVLSSDGTVRHILVLAGLPHGLTEAAMTAARQVKFTPAMIDGRPVSMFVQIEYFFNLY